MIFSLFSRVRLGLSDFSWRETIGSFFSSLLSKLGGASDLSWKKAAELICFSFLFFQNICMTVDIIVNTKHRSVFGMLPLGLYSTAELWYNSGDSTVLVLSKFSAV